MPNLGGPYPGNLPDAVDSDRSELQHPETAVDHPIHRQKQHACTTNRLPANLSTYFAERFEARRCSLFETLCEGARCFSNSFSASYLY
jgi:hypothetical protein